MLNISGFIAIGSMAINQPGVTSNIGEISNKSDTYSTEKGFYKSNQHADVRLVTFNSDEDGVAKEVPIAYSDEILRLSQWMYAKCINGDFNSSHEDARDKILQAFGAVLNIRHIGDMVTHEGYWMPESIIFNFTTLGKPNSIRLWFSDAAFRSQYDLYELVVVPPVDDIDTLVGNRESVLAVIDAIDVPSHNNRVATSAGDYSYTILNSKNYAWTDQNDVDFQVPTPWSVVVYGIAGNNNDIIRNAIIDYILANSEHPREVWEKIYPDLFLPNEFYITPMWQNRSLENMRTVSEIYSPTALVTEQLEAGVSTFYNIPISHIYAHIAHSSLEYKSLSFVSVGNWKNRNGNFNFKDQWPEFANLSTRSLDFNRMSVSTQQFYLKLVSAIMEAERYDEYSTLPIEFSIVGRGNNEYLVFTYEKIQYLISMPSNTIEDWPDDAIGDSAQTKYQVSWVVPDRPDTEDTSIHVHLMEMPASSNEYRLVDDPNNSVYWDAVWYDEDGGVVDTVELENSTPEAVIFTRDLQGLEGSEIRVYAKYNGRVIAGTQVIDFS